MPALLCCRIPGEAVVMRAGGGGGLERSADNDDVGRV